MANSTLAAIIDKVRFLTRSPEPAQLSTDDIREQINTFIQYDFPEHLRLFPLETTFSFYTQPNIDSYAPITDPLQQDNPLYNFNQKYTSFSGPVYIAGLEARLSQSREEFYRLFPFVNAVQSTQIFGDGVTVGFNGTLQQVPVLRNQVLFTAKDANNNGLVLSDDGNGFLISPDGVSFGTINYITGAFELNWAIAPAQGQPIISETYPYVTGIPLMVLYYDQIFTLRPVPNISYRVTMNAFIRPIELLETNQSPQLEQWWQYIAYGAAKKVFENRMDIASVELIMPEYKKQEVLVLRSTIMQQSNERVATIYTNQQQGAGFYPYGTYF